MATTSGSSSSSAAAAAGTRADPVCLIDSSSSDSSDSESVNIGDNNSVRGTAARRRKRPSAAAAGQNNNNSGSSGVADRFVPFRMYTTANDLHHPSNSSVRAPFTSTLREMVGLDSGPHHCNNHLGNMRWMAIFNYLVDFDYLLDEIPELLSLERCWCTTARPRIREVMVQVPCNGQVLLAGPSQWKSAAGSNLTTIRLVPSDPPNSTSNPLPFKMDYAVHHTKLFLVGYENALRVVVHTANLRASDLANNCQGAYVQDFPLKARFRAAAAAATAPPSATNGDGKTQARMIREHCDGDDSYSSSCPFEEELIRYLESYRRAERYHWPLDGPGWGDGRAPQLTLTEVLRRYDFSGAYGTLIPSVPGWHRLRNCPWGHLRLRDAIRSSTASPSAGASAMGGGDDDEDGDENNGSSGGSSSTNGSGTTGTTTGSIVLQFSSLGSISLRWLHELASSMDVGAARSSLRPLRGGAQSSPLLNQIQIVWPTHEEVRTAAAGYAAGGPIPGRVKNVDRAFLRSGAGRPGGFYHRWSSETDPLRKARYPGHCKTFLQLSPDGTEVEWCLLTSHNLSTAALGQIQNNSKMGEQCLFIRHWELGVLVTPETVRDAALAANNGGILGRSEEDDESIMTKKRKGGDGSNDDGDSGAAAKVRLVPFRGVDASYGENDVILPLPFDVAPTPYSSRDVPWATDRKGGLPDAFGRVLN